VLIKICGVRTAGELLLLADAGIDLVGVLCGTPGGHSELPVTKAAELVTAAGRAGRPRPVLVTLHRDARLLHEAVDRTGARWVQLHGYQPPVVVRELKARGDLTVVKVLHVRGSECLEERLIPAYERAGADLFLLDTTTADGRVGSTGVPAAPGAILSIADRLSLPFLLAGGISAAGRPRYDRVVEHPLFRGVDVDGGARDHRHGIDPGRVAGIARVWRDRP
jgi:phosphoribosylanthranilate isomerase